MLVGEHEVNLILHTTSFEEQGWVTHVRVLLQVDETAVLKHFDWPEAKVDALREATFEYLDLMKLQEELSLFEDKPELPCEEALKKMLTTLEK